MPARREEDLFSEGSSMSFGDHLEELRMCLFYSIGWLVVGVTLGLFAGGYVVDFIQRPLNKSLQKYYLDRGKDWLSTRYKELLNEGHSVDIVGASQSQRLIPQEFWLFPGELERALAHQRLMESVEAETGEPLLSLDEVDNLVERKRQRDEHRRSAPTQSLFSDSRTTNYAEKPTRIILWTKIDDDPRTMSRSFNPQEAFSIYLKASLLVGLVIAGPGIFYHIWSFIAAGLYPHEKKYVYYFMPISIGLFVGGAAFAFFVVFQFILDFLFWFTAWNGIQPEARISEWVGFALLLPVGFGISFQLPLVMFVLDRVRILSVELYLAQWRISVLVICILSCVLTPADPWSMLFMAVPLTGLYFLGIWMCKVFPRKDFRIEEA